LTAASFWLFIMLPLFLLSISAVACVTENKLPQLKGDKAYV